VIDSHAHLYLPDFDADREDVIERARAAGVEAIINIGIDAATSRAAVEIARKGPGLFASAGVHPQSKVADVAAEIDEVRSLARAERAQVVAIGEIGLDYYWKDVAPPEQLDRLLRQLALALELSLPVVVHCRDALPDLLDLLEGRPERPAGVFHCFAGGPEEARRALGLGFHVSFTGNVTYPKAEGLRAAAKAVPLDRLLLETDSPYLPPMGRRGKRNEPAFGVLTRDAIAFLHGLDPAELGRRTAENARRLFRLDAR
jgi:TatD DNase family protein